MRTCTKLVWPEQNFEEQTCPLFFSAALADEYGEAHSAGSTRAARSHLIGEGEWSAILGMRAEKETRNPRLSPDARLPKLHR